MAPTSRTSSSLQSTVTPQRETATVEVHVLEKWEKRGWFGSSFWIRVRMPDGTITDGKCPNAAVYYDTSVGTDLKVNAEKRDGGWFVPGFTRV